MIHWWRLKQWLRTLLNPPYVELSRWGQNTPRPQVSVSVISPWCGSMGVFTYDDTEQGNACVTMYGNDLARIMRRRLVDRR